MTSPIGPYSIALVSDFFCPNAGGVETHIYFLAQCLIDLGHRVVVITHSYGDRKGIRFLSNGLKVYYLPFIVAYNGATLSSIIGSMPWLRKVFLRENVQIIHGHSTFSALAHEALMIGGLMGLRTVFTDHSLFGFADASAILTNTLVLQYSLINVDQIICVSYTSKENTVLRGKLDPNKVSTIPNAIETSLFTPDRKQFNENPTTVIFLGRLVYRKGADLLCDIIPKVCSRHSSVRFIIGGDGPKRIELEEMREKFKLHERVVMLGMLPHNQVKQVLNQGQIFINTSLTEAFCMSIVEAASCGLHVVSTRVGGVPEVLPVDEFISLEEPVPDDLVDTLFKIIDRREKGELMDPEVKHKEVTKMYNWPDVAERTQLVYQKAEQSPSRSRLSRLKGFEFEHLVQVKLKEKNPYF
uniref:phosphatidylinositol N-acetylglucosaminyltransferase n=1 Tax=Caenorhabditis japonica TaxID=281687 RepID=A0A8R1HH33_CAEJA